MGEARPHWVPQSPGVSVLTTALTSAFTLNAAEGIQQKAYRRFQHRPMKSSVAVSEKNKIAP